MKKSIRHRIMFLFISLMAGVLLVIWAINSWWLEGYYTSQKVNVMEEAYETIDAAVMERVDAGENIGDVITREMAREWEIFSQLARPPFAGGEDLAAGYKAVRISWVRRSARSWMRLCWEPSAAMVRATTSPLC